MLHYAVTLTFDLERLLRFRCQVIKFCTIFAPNRTIRSGVIAISMCTIWAPSAIPDATESEFPCALKYPISTIGHAIACYGFVGLFSYSSFYSYRPIAFFINYVQRFHRHCYIDLTQSDIQYDGNQLIFRRIARMGRTSNFRSTMCHDNMCAKQARISLLQILPSGLLLPKFKNSVTLPLPRPLTLILTLILSWYH